MPEAPAGARDGVSPASVRRPDLVAYLDRYLDSDAGRDYGPNGLQVQGREEIRKLATGVSAGRELFERAAAAGADAVLVHHGIFWDFTSPLLVGFHYERVAALLRHDLSLLAYHLPLDRHPEVGNNALACRALGLERLEPFGIHEGLPVGFRGRFPAPVPVAELTGRCARVFGQQPLAFTGGPPTVVSLGMVSGGAQRELYQAIAAGLDAYVTGEASEWVMNVAREAGIHYLACGHYATERLGVRALGEHLAEKFGIEVEFIDLPNPV
jgi:dinuclear metal center YbgI/SA1388 family protein